MLDIYNVGLAAAKDLTVEWSFDPLPLLARINSATDMTGLQARYDSLGFLLVNEQLITDYPVQVRFVLPSGTSPSPTTIFACQPYLTLCALDYYTRLREAASGRPIDDAKVSYPPLKMILRYQDIGDLAYTKTVHVQLETHVFPDKVLHVDLEKPWDRGYGPINLLITG